MCRVSNLILVRQSLKYTLQVHLSSRMQKCPGLIKQKDIAASGASRSSRPKSHIHLEKSRKPLTSLRWSHKSRPNCRIPYVKLNVVPILSGMAQSECQILALLPLSADLLRECFGRADESMFCRRRLAEQRLSFFPDPCISKY